MDKHRCFVYMRCGTAAQIDGKRERGKQYENLAQILANEKAPRGARSVSYTHLTLPTICSV